MSNSLYDRDFHAWTVSQARLLREGNLAEVDAAHLAEEIEGVVSSERREMRTRLARLLQHLLKWHDQPDRRSRGWSATIGSQRDELAELLADSPSLRVTLPDALARAYRLGRQWALEESGLLTLSERCQWSAEQVLDRAFLPD